MRVRALFFVPFLGLLLLAVYLYMRPIKLVSNLINTGYNVYDSQHLNKH